MPDNMKIIISPETCKKIETQDLFGFKEEDDVEEEEMIERVHKRKREPTFELPSSFSVPVGVVTNAPDLFGFKVTLNVVVGRLSL